MSSSAKPSQTLATDSQEVLDEGSQAYRLGGFHPVYIGDVYHDRYEVLSKIGYGGYSTVWLVRDRKATKGESSEFRALKVLSAECYGAGKDIYEREILRHLRYGNPMRRGYEFICHLEDEFEHEGPNGTHVCLVFQLCGESMLMYGARFKDLMIPTEVMRRITTQLLLALDYAHKFGASNIFVKMKTYSRIENGYLAQDQVQQNRSEGQYTVIPSLPLSNYYSFQPDDQVDEIDIVLGDWGFSCWTDYHLCEVIQPVTLRAPEVLLGAGWGPAADVWSVGATVLEMYRDVRMFIGLTAPDGPYKLGQHLAEIEHLLGPFPKALLDKGDQGRVGRIFDKDGKVKDVDESDANLDKWSPDTVGRTFGKKRKFKYVDEWDADHNLMSEWYTPGLPQDVKAKFVAFLNAAMAINPADRPKPAGLLMDPWVHTLG
ncbi:hypothetical protein PG991_006311 [Apiospora marii]|uniref:non-specific serine/threonine protein kinase n=1 Tax=Apiospora marii TaxID=335849 RepID=A0ABR1SBN0_9PEZI